MSIVLRIRKLPVALPSRVHPATPQIVVGRLLAQDPRPPASRPLRARDDYRVSVDSHSGSPIYHDDHANLIAWGVRSQILGPEDAIEDLPLPHKDTKLQRLKERARQKQEFIEQHPEVLEHPQGGRKAGGLKAV